MHPRFGDRQTERFFQDGACPKAWRSFADELARKLDRVVYTTRLDDLKLPQGNNFEPLKGDLKGWYSIRIVGRSSRYRIVFQWNGKQTHSIKITDYHEG